MSEASDTSECRKCGKPGVRKPYWYCYKCHVANQAEKTSKCLACDVAMKPGFPRCYPCQKAANERKRARQAREREASRG